MATKTQNKSKLRDRRKRRIRRKLSGTSERLRLSVFRSSRHIYAQIIDDGLGKTLASASSQAKDLPAVESGDDGPTAKRAQAQQVGLLLAARCADAGIKSVRFDRSGYVYHGRVKALADGARQGGLEF